MVKTLSNINDDLARATTQPQLSEAELVEEYGGAVYKFCRRITCTEFDADDLFQDTFLNVFSQMAKIDAAESKQSFLLSTAAYLWKSQRRKYARHNRLAPEIEISEATDIISSRAASLEDDFMMKDEQRIVRSLVDALPSTLKIPIVLYYTNELSIADISLTLKIPAGTVKSRLHKARGIIEKGLVSGYGY